MNLIEVSSPVKVIAAAYALITDPAKWCRGASARNVKGSRVHPGSPDAIAWDIEGALGICDNPQGFTPIPLLHIMDITAHRFFPIMAPNVNLETQETEDPVWEYVAYESIHYLNDWCGHDTVLSLLSKSLDVVMEELDVGNNSYGRYQNLFSGSVKLHVGKETRSPKGG